VVWQSLNLILVFKNNNKLYLKVNCNKGSIEKKNYSILYEGTFCYGGILQGFLSSV
jgi:hypothetical protein